MKSFLVLSIIFFNISNSSKAIVCILIALEKLKINGENDQDSEKFMRNWTYFLINESGLDIDCINLVYTKLINYCSNFDKLSYINFSVKKTDSLMTLLI